jgi:DnaJ-class molecular chaperone
MVFIVSFMAVLGEWALWGILKMVIKMIDYYNMIGVQHFASESEIKRAFRMMAKRWHPDRNYGDNHAVEMFKKINEVYSVLSDPVQKEKYDIQLKTYLFNNNHLSRYAKFQTQKTRKTGKLDVIKNKVKRVVEELAMEDENPNKKPGYLESKLFEFVDTNHGNQTKFKLKGPIKKVIDLLYDDK